MNTPRYFVRWLLLALCGFGLAIMTPVEAQSAQDIVAMTVEAGYDNRYRPTHWVPLRVRVRNDGDGFNGRLTVRPETSGRVVSNSYSTPIDLPNGSEKVAYLYVHVQTTPARMTVELIDNEGVRVQQATVALTALNPQDALYLVVSGTGARSIPLGEVAPAGFRAAQARLTPEALPPDAAALFPVDTIFFYDADSSTLTTNQRQALADYVTTGGHLVVIGGPSWQTTAEGLTDLLPLQPTSSESVAALASLQDFVTLSTGSLDANAVIATGTLSDDAQVLIAHTGGEPLLARREMGAGTVDYLAADPAQEPFASWENRADFFVELLASPDPETGWRRGLLEPQLAANAIAILPDIDLLPPVTSMIAFIVAYIVLIGPVNYIVLSRINRREWAWVTIPILIVAFTSVAYTFGFNLRGSEVIVSRLEVVQTFPDEETARLDQLVGVLSPRRTTYTMSIPEERFLRILPSISRGNLLQQNLTQSSVEIVQQAQFTAERIAVDGGIYANFGIEGVTSAPAVSGSAAVQYNPASGRRTVRGLVRNDSDLTFTDGVIMAHNRFYRLDDPLEPGDTLDFDTGDFTDLDGQVLIPFASPFESAHALVLGNVLRSRFAESLSLQTSRIVMGNEVLRPGRSDEQASALDSRRELLAQTYLRDQYGTQGLGNEVYFAGFYDEIESDAVTLAQINYTAVDTGLLVAQLATVVETPSGTDTVAVTGDYFTWLITARQSAEGGVDDLTLVNPGLVEIQFTPLEGAVLREIEGLNIALDRSSSFGREVALALWDWEAGEWVELANRSREEYSIEQADAVRFTGPNNRVRLQLTLDREGGTSTSSARLRDLTITQIGRF